MFLHCCVEKCNRKYKTEDRYISHLLKDHKSLYFTKDQIKIPEKKGIFKLNSKIIQKSNKPSNKKSNKKDQEDDESNECVICLESLAIMAIIPCGHKCLCENCHSKMFNLSCPICRKSIEKICRIY